MDLSDPYAYKHLVQSKERLYTMETLQMTGKILNIFHKLVTLLMLYPNLSLRPFGSIQEGKNYSSEKHHMAGYKSEDSILANVRAIGRSKSHAGSVHDIDIFRSNISWHVGAVLNADGCPVNIGDVWELETEWNNNWKLLFYNAYTQIQSRFHAIIAIMKPVNEWMAQEEPHHNKNTSPDCVIVEN